MEKYPVVILPGWMLGSRRFEPLVKAFQKAGYETYIVDFPGFEQGVPLTQALDLTDYVRLLQKFLKIHQINKAIFVCHSFGGRVALKLLSQEPQKAVALVISGTPGFPGMTKLRQTLTLLIAKTGKVATYAPPFLFFRKKLVKMFHRLVGAHDYGNATGLLRETFKNIVKEQLIEYMKKIKIPTLLLWGEKDRLVSVKIAQRMQRLIVSSRLIIVPGVGHMFTYREPKIVVTEVKKFLESLD